MTEHNCEIPGWRCYGNGPIYLTCLADKKISWGGGNIVGQIIVKYCPFCGFSEKIGEIARKNDQI